MPSYQPKRVYNGSVTKTISSVVGLEMATKETPSFEVETYFLLFTLKWQMWLFILDKAEYKVKDKAEREVITWNIRKKAISIIKY